MEFNEYQELSKRTLPRFNGTRESFIINTANLAMGTSGEAGEVTDALKKMLFHGHDWEPLKVAEELGDLLWYVSSLATILNVKLEDIAKGNVEKLQGKGGRYENGFSHEASRNRTE